MNQQEFDRTLRDIASVPFSEMKFSEMRYDARLAAEKAFAEKQHEIDLLKAELAEKNEPEPVSLNKHQIEWLLDYFDGDDSDDPIRIKNSQNGPKMLDPSMSYWGWEGIKSESRYQPYNIYTRSNTLDWTVDQLTYQEPSDIIEFCDEAVAEIFADMYIEDCHQIVQLIENVETEKATPTDVRETGEICLLWVFLENGPA
jgi:hypothetical protein